MVQISNQKHKNKNKNKNKFAENFISTKIKMHCIHISIFYKIKH